MTSQGVDLLRGQHGVAPPSNVLEFAHRFPSRVARHEPVPQREVKRCFQSRKVTVRAVLCAAQVILILRVRLLGLNLSLQPSTYVRRAQPVELD